jgi:putative redox protein
MSDLKPYPPIHIEHANGARFRIGIRGHDLFVDQPRDYGDDSAPSPNELLGAALGGCAAYYIHRFCLTRGIDSHDVTVDVEQIPVRDPFRIGRFVVHVHLPSTLSHLQAELIERVVRTCPVYNTLARAADIDVEVGAEAGAV